VVGGLVFADEIERFAGQTAAQIAEAVCAGARPTTNIGGPAAAALIHAAQVLADTQISVSYYGYCGDDSAGTRLRELLARAPLDVSGLGVRRGETPNTIVLSDPLAGDGSGERTFINTIGVATEFSVDDVPAEFYRHTITYFGGTALVPSLHGELGRALRTASGHNCLTVVGTVYDFLNEKRNPDGLWPLGGRDAYRSIDCIACDSEEARRLTGHADPREAMARFMAWGVKAAVVTDGDSPVHYIARGDTFAPCPFSALPTSEEVERRAPLSSETSRDTTGCGDNFLGGVLSNIARQIAARGDGPIDLRDAVIEGIAAGAAAWFCLGSTHLERRAGEKAAMVADFKAAYLRQIGEAH
jgi:sugar/nucleoside kinase (ribokinase family)